MCIKNKEKVYFKNLRQESPKIFGDWSSESVLDFLSDTTVFSDSEKSLEEFYKSLEYGPEVLFEEPKTAEIIDFPKNKKFDD